MDSNNKKDSIEKRSFLDKIKEHTPEELEILGTFVRLGVVVWSGFIITLNYVEIPMIKKGQSGGDITFVASLHLTVKMATATATATANLTSLKRKKNETTYLVIVS